MWSWDGFYSNGGWVEPAGSSSLDVVSPSSERLVGRIPLSTNDDVDRAVSSARRAFDDGPWPRLSAAERADALRPLGDHLQTRADDLLQILVSEVGAPISGMAAIQAHGAGFMAGMLIDQAMAFPWSDERPSLVGGRTIVLREPVGVVASIVPWNGPLSLTLIKSIPALMAGCTVVVKPPPETPLNGYVVAECVDRLGLPPGVFNVVPGDREIGEHLVRHPDVDKVTFTGSTAAGRRVGGICGEHLKRCSLELGGKSAAIALEDADPQVVVPAVLESAFGTNGQQCFGLTRIVATDPVHDALVEHLVEAVAALRVGDPFDPATDMGPLVAERQRTRVEGYIESGRDDGCRVEIGGGRPDLDTGWYVEPTVFTGVDNSMRIAREEIFGPVLSVIRCRDGAEALAIANDSIYGLAGAVFSADVERGERIARRVRTGMLTVNGWQVNPNAPLGGFKCSGIGREFGPEGQSAFVEPKAINLPG